MPSLDDILRDTMMFTASPVGPRTTVGPGDAITTSTPAPHISTDEAVLKKNPVWNWKHDPNTPNELTAITSLVRGMGMNYAHPMGVAKSIRLEEVEVTLAAGGGRVSLPVTRDFVIRKHKMDAGRIAPSSSGLWQLETELDQSILIVFGYTVDDGTVKPLTAADVAKLGGNLMPLPSIDLPFGRKLKPSDEQVFTVAPLRIIVAWSVTCCKERPDYTPGDPLLGVNRLYPHAMVMTSQEVEKIRSLIIVERDAKSSHSGRMPPEPNSNLPSGDEMLPDLGPIFFADTNVKHSLVPLPFWNNIFEYYSLDPFGQGATSCVVTKPGVTKERVSGTLIQRLNIAGPSAVYEKGFVHKVARQGEFDNLHIAPKMVAPASLRIPGIGLDAISMAPFCVHDCLHTHVRWGLEFTDKAVRGFDDVGRPYTEAGAPLVPVNQEVSLNLIAPAGFGYEARAVMLGTEPLGAGAWTVFCHHGLGYANGLWDPKLFDLARSTVELFAKGERSAPDGSRSTACFYWRLRFGGAPNVPPMERIKILDLNACRNL